MRYLFLILMALFIRLSAQDITVSPYTAFGFGEPIFFENATISGMGGIDAVYQGPFGDEYNFSNPAANANLRLTTFNMGLNTVLEKFKTDQNSSERSASYISNLSLAFPIGQKWSAGIGFQPYTGVGYNSGLIVKNDDLTYQTNFNGDGGINSLHMGVGYEITPELSAGLRFNYLFGDLIRESIINNSLSFLTTQFRSNIEMNGLAIAGGLYYSKKLNEKLRLNLGATYQPESSLNSTTEVLSRTYQNNSNGTEFNIDTIKYENRDQNAKLPGKLSFGASLGRDRKWSFGTQVDMISKGELTIDTPNDVDRQDHYRIAAGGYFIPNRAVYSSYLENIVYRAGFYYDSGELRINDQDISEFGITFGVGLPIGKVSNGDVSTLNLGVVLGERGTIDNGLLKEQFAKIKVSFNLTDLWFLKRKYD